MQNKRVIITGGGDSGKTSIIDALSEMGYLTFPEVSRQIIKALLLVNGDLTLW